MGNETFDLKTGPETFQMLLEVDSAAYSKIAQAEQEHLNDFAHAYQITLAEATAIVNVMAESDFYGDTELEARNSVMTAINERLHPKLHADFAEAAPLTWQLALSNLILGTTRDAQGWHSAKTVVKPGGIDLAKKTITHVIDFSGTQIGTHPSSEHVSLDNLP
jgi:hypothetical protein